MLQLICLFVVFLTINGQQEFPDADTRMGYGFFLPDHDLLGLFTGGTKIFENLNPQCIVTVKTRKHRRDTSYFSDASSFFSSLSSKTGVNGKLQGKYTMGMTMNAKSTSIASADYQASGASLFMHVNVKDEVLSSTCQNNLDLDPKLKAAFEKLPVEIKNPHFHSSWTEYETFLQTYGSHFISTTHFGAYLEQYNFAKSSKSYSHSQFESRVCADFLGPTKYGDLNVTACTGMTYNQIQSATRLEMTSQFTVLGGTFEARTNLLMDRTDKNIAAFLNSATESSPVGYRFTALWDLLQSKYVSTTHHAKAMNLEFFYAGFLDTGCSYKKDSRSGFELQKFVVTEIHTINRPSYKCINPAKGCNNNNDCHIGGGGFVCYCYGNSCIDYRQKTIASKTVYEPYVKFSSSGSYGSGVNNSCKYQANVSCRCRTEWGGSQLTLWSAENVYLMKK